MPKRSNQFQRAIFLLNQRLAGTTSSIQESEELLDAVTGKKREVDVVVRSTLPLGQIHCLGIECIDHKRPADSTWVETMYAKHQHLPTNSLMLASRNGYYKPARTKAEKLGILLVEVSEIGDELASAVIGKLNSVFMQRITMQLQRVVVSTASSSKSDFPHSFPADASSKVCHIDGASFGNMEDLVREFYDTLLGRRLETGHRFDGNQSFHLSSSSVPTDQNGEPIFLDDGDGRQHQICAINVWCRILTNTHEIPLDHGVIGNQAASWGDSTVEGKEGGILLVESDGRTSFSTTFTALDLTVDEEIKDERTGSNDSG